MSRTHRGSKAPGDEYWASRLHPQGEPPGWWTKQQTHRKERREAKAVIMEPDNRPIEEVLAELAAEVPADEWANVPTGLASNLDYYLYDVEGQREMERCNGMTR